MHQLQRRWIRRKMAMLPAVVRPSRFQLIHHAPFCRLSGRYRGSTGGNSGSASSGHCIACPTVRRRARTIFTMTISSITITAVLSSTHTDSRGSLRAKSKQHTLHRAAFRAPRGGAPRPQISPLVLLLMHRHAAHLAASPSTSSHHSYLGRVRFNYDEY